MESFKLFTSVLLLIADAHAWGSKSSHPVNCLVTEWTSWSGPIFAASAIRTRAVLRTSAKGGVACPTLIDIRNSTGTQVTVKQVADEFTNSFLNPYVVHRSRTTRQAEIGNRRDLLVILDSSSSIGGSNFALAIDEIADLLSLLCPKSSPFDGNMHKLAVIRYSSLATEIFDFNAYTTTYSTLQAVRKIKYVSGGTNTAAAFKLAINMLVQAKGARLDQNTVKQDVLILTDGHSSNPKEAIDAAKSLQEVAEVFGLVIGTFSDAGRNEVLQYVSPPIKGHLFWLESFKKLTDLVQYVRANVQNEQCAPFDTE